MHITMIAITNIAIFIFTTSLFLSLMEKVCGLNRVNWSFYDQATAYIVVKHLLIFPGKSVQPQPLPVRSDINLCTVYLYY